MSSLTTGQDDATAPPLQSTQEQHHHHHHHLESPPPAPPAPEKPTTPLLPLLHTHAHLTLFSILGTLSRLGLTGLTAPANGGLIWAQFGGCVAMGVLLELPRPSVQTQTQMPLFVGLTTGFCGSVTSFSGMMLGVFEALTTSGGRGGGAGRGVMAALGYGIATMALSVGGLRGGGQAVELLLLLLARPGATGATGAGWAGRWVDWVVGGLAVGVWGAAVVLAVLRPQWRGEAVLACVFSPLGAVGRFWVGRWLNAGVRTFPVGTFVVNVVGTAVLGGAVVGRYSVGGGGTAGCGLVRGVADGFCGCFTTVSTFVVELRGLRLKHAYVYAGTSIAVGFAVMVAVLGSYKWSHGEGTLRC